MKNFLVAMLAIGLTAFSVQFVFASDVSGRILLDVENNGEAWYVNPVDNRRYYLGRPDDALSVMRTLGLGISNADLNRFDSDASFRKQLAGKILLQVESKGEAYYVDADGESKYYLGRPQEALNVMQTLGLGISSSDLSLILTGSFGIPDIYYDIPFVAQAPFGDWGDLRQQEGCEETSVLMALAWARGESLSTQNALEQIVQVSDWQQDAYSYYHDTSVQDTADRLFKEFFSYEGIEVVVDISSDDILHALEKDNVVVTAIDGVKMNHNYYSSPGPQRHMILIHGFDAVSQEFIAHDPGTRFGKDHRIPYYLLNEMLRDYPSGVYAPITPLPNAMIIVSR